MTRLLEHQSLLLLEAAGVTVAPYRAVDTPAAAAEAARALGGPVILKALVPAGGRQKAGGVTRITEPADAASAAGRLLGSTLGHFPVTQVLVQACVDIREEYFCALTFDSVTRSPVMLFSAEGGVDVEDLVRDRPDALVSRPVEPTAELPPFVGRELGAAAGVSGQRLLDVADVLTRLYAVFRNNDGFLVEVNPLAVDGAGRLVALSAVVVVDEQAEFRHPEWARLVDPAGSNGWRPLTTLERAMREIDATDAGSAIRFNEFEDGAIACMMTGGGSGLVTFDHLRRLGETPATTFDITPGRVEEKMYLATKAILSRPGLRGLVAGGNISNFIPIDVKVRGVVRALAELGVDAARFPVVFRYAGPGVESAREIAAKVPGIEFYDERVSLEEAVERIVARVREPGRGPA
ncbi:MAG TPA: ATP-grasp domain-containing protein [Candidatus Methylomirabilis sp.]|nr:ATP-grasp domain-containing protein [Candidatus Methylomirabilis sp.]